MGLLYLKNDKNNKFNNRIVNLENFVFRQKIDFICTVIFFTPLPNQAKFFIFKLVFKNKDNFFWVSFTTKSFYLIIPRSPHILYGFFYFNRFFISNFPINHFCQIATNIMLRNNINTRPKYYMYWIFWPYEQTLFCLCFDTISYKHSYNRGA